ncbi:MAG TPA: hypothetical protein VN616_06490 [Puia sp.]|nr:hypothetical protein [Puia sp.]
MKLTYLLTGLILVASCCRAQSTDTTRTKRPGIFERRRRLMEESREQQMQQRLAAQDAQASKPLFATDSARWSLSFNPFGLLEPVSAVGLGVGYRTSQHWQLWLESSYLYQMYNDKPAAFGGVRESLALKYYFGARQSLFFAAEARWKQVWFHDVQDFNDQNTGLADPGYHYTLKDIIGGGAIWFGGMVRLSDDHRWRIEFNAGLGIKSRTVERQGVPEGWTYTHDGDFFSSAFSWTARHSAPFTFYFPAAIRLVRVL